MYRAESRSVATGPDLRKQYPRDTFSRFRYPGDQIRCLDAVNHMDHKYILIDDSPDDVDHGGCDAARFF